jgi:hypothetical protein
MHVNTQIGFGSALLLLMPLQAGPGRTAQSKGGQNVEKSAAKSCPRTLPRKAPSEAQKLFGACCAPSGGHLFVGGLWPNGIVVVRPNGPGSVERDGSLSMKFGWQRGRTPRKTDHSR